MISLLEIQNLAVTFGHDGSIAPAVQDLGFGIRDKEALGQVWKSASEKSVPTLAIMGLLDSSASVAGTIRFAGQNLLQLDTESMRRLTSNTCAR